MSHNIFKGNQALDGAAIQIEERANPRLENNSFLGNSASRHGGAVVVNIYAAPVIRFNAFVRNHAGVSGGLYLIHSNAKVTGNQIVDNQAHTIGGGVVVDNQAPTVENNLVSRNRASQGGAGFYLSNSQPTLRHNTIASNGRDRNGDGVMLANGAAPSLSYNVIVGNDIGIRSAGGQPRQIMRNSLFDNRLGNYQGVTPGANDLLVDPLFAQGPMGAYYLAQTAAGQGVNSPLIDACTETAQALDLHLATTRTDGQPDRGLADIGFHFVSPPPKVFIPLVRLSD